MTTTTPTVTTTTVTTDPDRHLALALADLAAGHSSTAASRAARIAQECVRGPLRCPCELAGLWRGVPLSRRRHAVLCALWTPEPPRA